jgi:hypothetical protein
LYLAPLQTGYDGPVQLIRLIVIALAGVAAVAGYIHEARRLQVVQQLPGDQARAYYESGRARGERLMWLVTAALAAAAVAALLGYSVLPAVPAAALKVPH